jgi:hypothetical protein
MVFPVFHEYDADGTIRTNGMHWECFQTVSLVVSLDPFIHRVVIRMLKHIVIRIEFDLFNHVGEILLRVEYQS